MGDFNPNVVRNTRHSAVANVNDCDQGRKLTNVLSRFALINVIKEPTKITETTNYGVYFDWCIINIIQHVS